ncbi:SMI1/KNR4 family protein [Nonomuraea sp. NPDC005692]|uniref:SMI1/KNR4 family protein n=1 Tax=Nonomuraea sp. NPDC005692 TaxID=3157168 RepID=UPI0033E0D1E5
MTEDEIFAAVRASVGPDLPPPATETAVAEAEEAVGYPLPSLLRRLYLEVGNGGFGPRGGVIGVRGYDFWASDIYPDITASALELRTEPSGRWSGMVQLMDWGCGIASLLDCRDPAGAMWGWDPNRCCFHHALFPQDISFADWLADSLGRGFDDVFYDGYFDVLVEEADGIEPVGLKADEDEEEEEPCAWVPPAWVNGRQVGGWRHRPAIAP